jgi:hypothetical protein
MVALIPDPDSLTIRERHPLFKQRLTLDNPPQNPSRLRSALGTCSGRSSIRLAIVEFHDVADALGNNVSVF